MQCLAEVPPSAVLCSGKERWICKSRLRFCLSETTTVQRPWVKPPSSCPPRRQNCHLRTWDFIRRKENTLNSQSLDRIALRFASKWKWQHISRNSKNHAVRDRQFQWIHSGFFLKVRELLMITLQKNWEWKKWLKLIRNERGHSTI